MLLTFIILSAVFLLSTLIFLTLWIRTRESEKLEAQKVVVRDEKLREAIEVATQNRNYLVAEEEAHGETIKLHRALEEQVIALRSQQNAKELLFERIEQELEGSKEECQELEARLDIVRSQLELKDRDVEVTKTQLTAEKSYIERLQEDFEKQKVAFKDEFKALSEGILKQREKEFTLSSQDGINTMLSPMKEAFGVFKKRVEEVHHEQTKGQGQLENELKTLKQMNTQLSERAENLTSALKNDKKQMGNWGEIQLERLLENSGLDENCYRREANFKTDEGQNQRPDFVIDLPEGKHLVIDSKVSLNAYVEGVNKKDDDERLVFIKQHTTNVRNHIKGLAEKSYDSLELLNAPDFVFMFMPNEAAYLAAFEEDASLFDFAYDKKVAVVTPNTLLPILRTVSSLWRVDKQNKSTILLAQSAEKLHKKFVTFMDRFERLGTQITTLTNTYTDAKTSLAGRGSLLGLIRDFEAKGVKVTKSLPDDVDTTEESAQEELRFL